MHVTVVNFRTQIDCCRKYMGQNSGLQLSSINPLVGDSVRVYHDSKFEIWMKVIERSWVLINGSSPVLECYLGLQNGWTIPDFEQVLKNRGFSW